MGELPAGGGILGGCIIWGCGNEIWRTPSRRDGIDTRHVLAAVLALVIERLDRREAEERA